MRHVLKYFFLIICWHKCGRVYWHHHRTIVHSQSELTHNISCLYVRYNSCGLTRKWDNRNLQISSTMDSSKAKRKYTQRKNMNATLNATYINLFNRLNKIKDKIRSENSRKALVDFSIFGRRRRQKLFSEERREILNFSKISLVVGSVYSR